MTNISFKGFNDKALTLPCEDEVAAGDVLSINRNGECVKANENDAFIGLCVAKRGNAAAVQMTGYAELEYTGSAPEHGCTLLAANGENGVNAVSEGGVNCKVIKVDADNKIVGFIF